MHGNDLKAILFDLDNTLIDTAGAGDVAIQNTTELLRAALGLDVHSVGAVCDKFRSKLLHEAYDPSEGKTIDEVRVGHLQGSLREVTGCSPDPGLAEKCYYLWKNTRLGLLTLSAPVRDLLIELRARYKLVLLTNGESQTQREKLEASGCQVYFDAVVVGGEHAEEKPSPAIFAHCLSLLGEGVAARDCVMVGDSLDTDVLGGARAGVRATVWVNKRGGPPPEGAAAKPDYTISTVLDLPGVLAAINWSERDLVPRQAP